MRPLATLALAGLLASSSACADEPSGDSDDHAFAVILAGGATALLPTIAGATVTGAAHTVGTKNLGWVIAGGGLSLSPIVAHGVAGEWDRGVLFAIPPALFTTGYAAYMAASPTSFYSGTLFSRSLIGGLFSLDVLASAVSIVDACFARDRAPKPRPTARRLWLSPSAAGVTGLSIGGTL